MASELFVDNITGKTGTSGGAPITLSGDTATLGTGVTVPASIGGSKHLIQKQTASSVALLEFTSLGNHSAFTLLEFVFSEIMPATDDVQFRARIATSGTSYQTSNYHFLNFYYERNTSSGTTGHNVSDNTSTEWCGFGGTGNNTTNDGGINGTMTVYNHNSSSVYKSGLSFVNTSTHNDWWIGKIGHSTYRANKNAFAAIKFEMSSGNISSGSITMYGVKDA